MTSERKNDKLDSTTTKNKNIISTDTDLHLDLFADQTKLKPISKVININHINSEDSHIMDKEINSDSDSSTESISSNHKSKNTRSARKQSSSKSSSTSGSSNSSSVSSKRSSEKKTRSETHTKMNNYVDKYNNNKTEQNLINQSDQPNAQSEMPKQVNQMPNVYIPKYQTEREIRFRKMELLCILKNIKKSGRDLSKDYTINSDLEDMEMEVRFHTENEKKRVSVGFAKDGMLKMCQFFEIMNNNFDPFGVNLKGWHAQMTGNIDNYDTVFEELFEKYKNYVGRVEPEYKLMYMIFGSAASFHYSKQFVEQFGLEKMVANNPELLQKIQANIASTMEKNIGKKDESANQAKNNLPTVSQQEMYQQMLKEKELLNKKVQEQEKLLASKNTNIHQSNNVNDTINQMMSMKKPSQLSDLLTRVKTNTNTELLIPLDSSPSATSHSRIKVSNTLDSDSYNSENANSISQMRKTRRQRPQVNV